MKILIIYLLVVFPVTELFPQRIKREKRRIQLEQIEQSISYPQDDTIAAITRLFAQHRDRYSRNIRAAGIVGGISVLSYLGGGMIFKDEMSNGPGGPMNPANYDGLGMMFIGVVGAGTSTVMAGVALLKKNPYTKKKYQKLIEWHKSGKPLPDFYLKRIQPFLN